MTNLKHCHKCGEWKPRIEYYREPSMTDGLLGKCKVCARIDATRSRRARIAARKLGLHVVIEPAPKPEGVEVHWLTQSWRTA